MACDLCGDKDQPTLTQLVSKYQTDDVKSVCFACEKTLNTHIWKIRALLDGTMVTLMRRYITERHSQCNAKEPPHDRH